jgi:membrane protein YqaA with SNARE-associated domain
MEMAPVKIITRSGIKGNKKNWSAWLYSQSIRIADNKLIIWLLAMSAFTDASFIPLPVTTFFLILIIINPKTTFKYIIFVTAGTLSGSIAGYLAGRFAWIGADGEFTRLAHFLFDNIPGVSLDFYNQTGLLFSKWGIWILSIATITPIPYGIFSISSGVFNINIYLFSIVTLVCQVLKYFLVGYITLKSGRKIKISRLTGN